jgi:hypothetical protein
MATMTAIDNSADIIDSRDVIARIEELEAEREDISSALDDIGIEVAGETDEPLSDEARAAIDAKLSAWDASEDGEELAKLRALAEQCEGYGDWDNGEALIRDSYFEQYAEGFADDLGLVNRDARWPANCIDWEKAARELQQDYTQVDFDGVDYWMRS